MKPVVILIPVQKVVIMRLQPLEQKYDVALAVWENS